MEEGELPDGSSTAAEQPLNTKDETLTPETAAPDDANASGDDGAVHEGAEPLDHHRTQDEVSTNYLMPPPNISHLASRTVETPPPVDYQVPSFLKKPKAKSRAAR